MSSTTTASHVTSRGHAVREEFQLTSWPLRDEKLAWLIVAGELGCAAVILFLTASAAMAVLGFLVLAVSSWRLWIPVHFEFGPRGVLERILGRQRRVGWHLIHSYQTRQQGVLLLPLPAGSPMDSFRGLFIPFRGQRDELLAVIERYLVRRPPSSHGSTARSA